MNNTNKSFEIVKAEASHIENISKIEKKSFTAPWSDDSIASAVDSDLINCISLLSEEKVCGYAMFSFVCDEGELLNLAVAPECRGLGYGDALLSHIIECGSKEGCKNLFLEVRSSNTAAHSLYKKHGFTEIGKRKNYYRYPVEDAIIMVLSAE